MNSKERVRTSFSHQEPDRVPVNYSAIPGIDQRLKAHFGLSAADDEGLLEVLGVDFRGINPPYIGPQLHPDVPDRRVDIWGIHTRWVEHGHGGGYWDFCDFPLKHATLEEVKAWKMPSPDDFDYSLVPALCEKYQDYCIYTGGGGTCDIMNSTTMIRSMEQTLVDLIEDNPVGLTYIDRRLEIQLEIVKRTLEAARGKIDMLWLGEDLGSQRGPLISMDLFRKHIRPRHQKFIDLAKQYNLMVIFHSCGSSSWAFDELIEMGVDIVDTLQPEAKNMSPEYLKRRFGEKLSFHGCISTAGVIAHGTVDDTIKNVRETLDIMMPGGGFAIAPTHMLQDNTPTENVVAMYETIRKFGSYRS